MQDLHNVSMRATALALRKRFQRDMLMQTERHTLQAIAVSAPFFLYLWLEIDSNTPNGLTEGLQQLQKEDEKLDNIIWAHRTAFQATVLCLVAVFQTSTTMLGASTAVLVAAAQLHLSCTNHALQFSTVAAVMFEVLTVPATISFLGQVSFRATCHLRAVRIAVSVWRHLECFTRIIHQHTSTWSLGAHDLALLEPVVCCVPAFYCVLTNISPSAESNQGVSVVMLLLALAGMYRMGNLRLRQLKISLMHKLQVSQELLCDLLPQHVVTSLLETSHVRMSGVGNAPRTDLFEQDMKSVSRNAVSVSNDRLSGTSLAARSMLYSQAHPSQASCTISCTGGADSATTTWSYLGTLDRASIAADEVRSSRVRLASTVPAPGSYGSSSTAWAGCGSSMTIEPMPSAYHPGQLAAISCVQPSPNLNHNLHEMSNMSCGPSTRPVVVEGNRLQCKCPPPGHRTAPLSCSGARHLQPQSFMLQAADINSVYRGDVFIPADASSAQAFSLQQALARCSLTGKRVIAPDCINVMFTPPMCGPGMAVQETGNTVAMQAGMDTTTDQDDEGSGQDCDFDCVSSTTSRSSCEYFCTLDELVTSQASPQCDKVRSHSCSGSDHTDAIADVQQEHSDPALSTLTSWLEVQHATAHAVTAMHAVAAAEQVHAGMLRCHGTLHTGNAETSRDAEFARGHVQSDISQTGMCDAMPGVNKCVAPVNTLQSAPVGSAAACARYSYDPASARCVGHCAAFDAGVGAMTAISCPALTSGDIGLHERPKVYSASPASASDAVTGTSSATAAGDNANTLCVCLLDGHDDSTSSRHKDAEFPCDSRASDCMENRVRKRQQRPRTRSMVTDSSQLTRPCLNDGYMYSPFGSFATLQDAAGDEEVSYSHAGARRSSCIQFYTQARDAFIDTISSSAPSAPSEQDFDIVQPATGDHVVWPLVDGTDGQGRTMFVRGGNAVTYPMTSNSDALSSSCAQDAATTGVRDRSNGQVWPGLRPQTSVDHNNIANEAFGNANGVASPGAGVKRAKGLDVIGDMLRRLSADVRRGVMSRASTVSSACKDLLDAQEDTSFMAAGGVSAAGRLPEDRSPCHTNIRSSDTAVFLDDGDACTLHGAFRHTHAERQQQHQQQKSPTGLSLLTVIKRALMDPPSAVLSDVYDDAVDDASTSPSSTHGDVPAASQGCLHRPSPLSSTSITAETYPGCVRKLEGHSVSSSISSQSLLRSQPVLSSLCKSLGISCESRFSMDNFHRSSTTTPAQHDHSHSTRNSAASHSSQAIFPAHVPLAGNAHTAGSAVHSGSAGHFATKRLAEWHDNVTIVFADVCGFTSMAQQVHPELVMSMLDDMYRRFDDLCLASGQLVYKVETIGDCYMVATGLLVPDPGHALTALRFALNMRQQAAQVLLPTTQQPVRIRVGIHSGRCMSGIVGKLRRRYCLFGDTVNTASRMESMGAVDCIHISPDTHHLVRHASEEFRFRCRGAVQVKGKGPMTTWWVDAAEAPCVGPAQQQQPVHALTQQPCCGLHHPPEYSSGGLLLPSAAMLLEPRAPPTTAVALSPGCATAMLCPAACVSLQAGGIVTHGEDAARSLQHPSHIDNTRQQQQQRDSLASSPMNNAWLGS